MDYDIFISRLTERMRELGISSKQLAVSANLSEAALSRYLNRLRKPTVDNIISLASALEVSTDWLLGLSETLCDKKLVHAYSNASDDDRRVVWAVLDKYGG